MHRHEPSRRPRQIASFSVFNLILAFFPLTTLLSSNPHILWQPISRELQFLIGFFFAIFTLNELLFLRFKSWRTHALFYLAVFLFFSWKLILDSIGVHGISGMLLYSILVAALFFVALRASRSQQATLILATMLFCFAAVPVIRLLLTAAQGKSPEPLAKQADTEVTATASASPTPSHARSPNVYLIIFDTMASTGQFLEYVDASQGSKSRTHEFEDAMQTLGYDNFAQAWSNYGRTSSSMLSFFNFDYLYSDFKWKMKYYGLTQSAMLDYFKSAGYRIVSSKKDVPCPEAFDHCYPTVNQLELVSMLASTSPILYSSQRLDEYLFRPLGSNALRKVTAKLTSTKLAEVDQFIEYISNRPHATRPEFTYAHFFAAHPRNFYDENCNTESLDLFEQSSGEGLATTFNFARYGAEYFCFLKKIVEVARAIDRSDPDSWVFITSDHGYGIQSYGTASKAPWDKTRLDATFRVLNLAKTSPLCSEELKALKSSVNKARGLINCLEETDSLPYLQESVDLRYIGPDVQLTIDENGYGQGAARGNSAPLP